MHMRVRSTFPFVAKINTGSRWEVSFKPGAAISPEKEPPLHFWVGGRVGHRIHKNALESWKVFFSCQQSKPHSTAVHSLVTKPTELFRLHYLHASTRVVSVTTDYLTRLPFLPPHNPRANTAQFWSQPTHFITFKFFFTFEKHYFSSWLLQPVLDRPFVLG